MLKCMNFTWDEKKAKSNLRNHGVRFLEAGTVFLDPLSMTGADPGHSQGEERWLRFGISTQRSFLVVSHGRRRRYPHYQCPPWYQTGKEAP